MSRGDFAILQSVFLSNTLELEGDFHPFPHPILEIPFIIE
jgi:hypothetical protein